MTDPGSSGGATSGSGPEHWLGRDDLPWNILLVASLDRVPSTELLRRRLAELSSSEGWPEPPEGAVVEGEVHSVVTRLGALVDRVCPVSVGRTPSGLVVRAHHAYVDGLGLLAVLSALLDEEVASGATGIGDRGRRSTVATMATRVLELALRPPAPVASSPGGSQPTPGEDVYAVAVVPRAVRTAELAHAAVQAIASRNVDAHRRADRIALAVGVSTTGGADLRGGGHRGLLRVTHAERVGVGGLEQALATRPLQV
ncbi:MAG: hypothetical protein ABWY19_16260, partial [Marmoricola sp.]